MTKTRLAIPPLLMDDIEDCVASGLYRDADDVIVDALRGALMECEIGIAGIVRGAYAEYMTLRNQREDAEIVEADIPEGMIVEVKRVGKPMGMGLYEFAGVGLLLLSDRMADYRMTREGV